MGIFGDDFMGGLFDLNNDGVTDFGEEAVGFAILDDISTEEEDELFEDDDDELFEDDED